MKIMSYICCHKQKHIVQYKTFNIMKVNEIMANLEAKHPGENEYLQAVEEYKAGGKNAKKPVLEKNKIPPRPKYHFFGSYRTNANHPNYVFFKTDQGECSTAVVCKNIFLFNRLNVDKKIKLLKHKEINGDTLEIAVVE